VGHLLFDLSVANRQASHGGEPTPQEDMAVVLGVACQKQSSLCGGCISKTQMAFRGRSWVGLCSISAHEPPAPPAECKRCCSEEGR
jgi:hypothetical protein